MPKALRILLMMCLAIATPVSLVGCSDDDDDEEVIDDMDSSVPDEDSSTPDEDSSTPDEDSSTPDEDSGEPMGDCDILGADKPRASIDGPIEADTTLTSDTVWELGGQVLVTNGAILTIEACTRIEATEDNSAVIIGRGAQIDAVGEPDAPIVFTTSVTAEEGRAAGLWGGVILLGNGVNFDGTQVVIEGLTNDEAYQHGGDDNTDSSGRMSYVRLEFGGFALQQDREINGLTFGSVGSGTQIDHIMVNTTLDDCFEFFGGAVSPEYLICNNVGDDMFDVDTGYKGSLTYLFGRQITPITDDPNGFEWDSDEASLEEPRTEATASNITLCGAEHTQTTIGTLYRENVLATVDNIMVSGFDVAVQVDEAGTDATDGSFAEVTDYNYFGNAGGDDTDGDTDAPYTNEDCLADDGPTDAVTGSGTGAFVDGIEGWNWDGAWISWDVQ